MGTVNKKEAMAHDLHSAAIHEAGHSVIAAHFGVPTHAELRKNASGGEDVNWVGGWTRMFGKPSSAEAARVIGLAGVVAEAYAADDRVDGGEIADYLALGVMALSETDAGMAGGWTADDVERCLGLVRDAWPEIERQAAWLENTVQKEEDAK